MGVSHLSFKTKYDTIFQGVVNMAWSGAFNLLPSLSLSSFSFPCSATVLSFSGRNVVTVICGRHLLHCKDIGFKMRTLMNCILENNIRIISCVAPNFIDFSRHLLYSLVTGNRLCEYSNNLPYRCFLFSIRKFFL
jgi:hypothetical protein